MGTMDEPIYLQVQLWWATCGTACTVVPALSKDDAEAVAAWRFKSVGLSGRVSGVKPATAKLYERFQVAMDQTLHHHQIVAEMMARRAESPPELFKDAMATKPSERVG